MNTNGEDWAIPKLQGSSQQNAIGQLQAFSIDSVGGMTKREFFALFALQGLLSANQFGGEFTGRFTPQIMATMAVKTADELVMALRKSKENINAELQTK